VAGCEKYGGFWDWRKFGGAWSMGKRKRNRNRPKSEIMP